MGRGLKALAIESSQPQPDSPKRSFFVCIPRATERARSPCGSAVRIHHAKSRPDSPRGRRENVAYRLWDHVASHGRRGASAIQSHPLLVC